MAVNIFNILFKNQDEGQCFWSHEQLRTSQDSHYRQYDLETMMLDISRIIIFTLDILCTKMPKNSFMGVLLFLFQRELFVCFICLFSANSKYSLDVYIFSIMKCRKAKTFIWSADRQHKWYVLFWSNYLVK